MVTIDKRRKWWRGTDAADLDEMLRAFSADGHPVERIEHARCASCGSAVFAVRLDDDEGFAQRTCVACRSVVLLLDSDEDVDEVEPGDAACPCGGEQFQVAVGFAFYQQSRDVRWVYVALRCVSDGVLGVYCDWKIDYAPTNHLFAKV